MKFSLLLKLTVAADPGGSAPERGGSTVCHLREFPSVFKLSYASRILSDTVLAPHDDMNTMLYSLLLLMYAQHVLVRHTLEFKSNVHILRGSPCIHIVKSSIFQFNISFNCVVNIYQKGGDCWSNQALSGFW